MFTLNGILYNDQTNLPAFVGYDNEIQLWLNFYRIYEYSIGIEILIAGRL